MDRERFARGRDAFDRNRVQSSRLSLGERLGVRASHRISKESPGSPYTELSPLDLGRWVKACRNADLSKPKVGEARDLAVRANFRGDFGLLLLLALTFGKVLHPNEWMTL